jgi:hypothetical protein
VEIFKKENDKKRKIEYRMKKKVRERERAIKKRDKDRRRVGTRIEEPLSQMRVG